ncbi:MAG: diphthine--ammonia ligase [Thermoplasmata archaeon]
MKAISLYSGGKDSTFALYMALQQGMNIEKLVSINPLNKESVMYHVPNIEHTKTIAEAIGIPLDLFYLSDDPNDLEEALGKYDAEIVVSGAIKSEFQKTKLERICTNLNKISYTPLWYKDEHLLIEEIIKSGFEVYISAVSAEGLKEDFLGAKFDMQLLSKLVELNKKYRINISGEGGEYESIVLYAPFFKKRLVVKEYSREWFGSSGIFNIKKLEILQDY